MKIMTEKNNEENIDVSLPEAEPEENSETITTLENGKSITNLKNGESIDNKAEEESDTSPNQDNAPTSSRSNLQLPRRLFHCTAGVSAGLIYITLLTHQQAVYILGTCACILYVLEQIRINYPKHANYVQVINRYFLRAEEHLKESAAIPYLMGLLLTIISFPKSIALVAIFTLAIADPLSAIIGIKYGKHHLVEGKSLEGSFAFFMATLIVTISVLANIPGNTMLGICATGFFLALFATAFEMLPIRLDDNLTIPLFVAVTLWIITSFTGIHVI